jgi:hypothetical protein
MRSCLNKLREELTTSEAQLRQLMVSRPVTETLEQQNRLARLQSEIAAAELSLQHTTISSPGWRSDYHSTCVTPVQCYSRGRPLLRFSLPGHACSSQARLANKDVAFIERLAGKTKV